MKINTDYHITKKGIVKTNPNVMPYDLLMSINRAHSDLKEGRYVEEILKWLKSNRKESNGKVSKCF